MAARTTSVYAATASIRAAGNTRHRFGSRKFAAGGVGVNMRFGTTLAWSLGLSLAIASPAAAQERAATNGRSIASLAGVPLKTRDGKPITLGSRIVSGKPTLISIWASWCPPCMVEAPYLNKMRKDLAGRYNFVYVNRRDGNPDPSQPADSIARFLAHGGLSDSDYVVADVKAYQQIVAADLKDIPDGKVGIPRVYLFDSKGRQIYTSYGFQPSEAPALEARLKQAMAK
ncbi:MAG: TlpA disulfide reductase family protein [Sphingomonas aquatilis]|jgi:thiol-disulfide isomerase/thioredoxin|uniref:TlpA family protein disulfide reductase n=1 Tax=Sphingomonas aquatilis TaxID=93063 RepID=UPI002F34B7BF